MNPIKIIQFLFPILLMVFAISGQGIPYDNDSCFGPWPPPDLSDETVPVWTMAWRDADVKCILAPRGASSPYVWIDDPIYRLYWMHNAYLIGLEPALPCWRYYGLPVSSKPPRYWEDNLEHRIKEDEFDEFGDAEENGEENMYDE